MLTKILLNDWIFAGLCLLLYTLFTGIVLFSAYRWNERDLKRVKP